MATRYDQTKRRSAKSTPRSGLWKWVAVAFGFLAVSGSTVWAAKYIMSARRLSVARSTGAELFSEETRALPEAERRAKFETARQVFESLSEEERDALRDEREERFRQRFEEDMTAFFELTPEERTREMDRRIDREEERRKEWAERRAQWERERKEREARGETVPDRGRRGDGDGRGGDGNRGPSGGDSASSGTSGGGRGGDGARSGGGSSWRSDPQRRNEWRKKRLDQSSPKMRAMMTEYRRLSDERRKARGLPPSSGRSYGGFGRG